MALGSTAAPPAVSIKERIQRFGGYLAGMVMPNIGAFIAWGLITALFIPTGWLPNKTLVVLVDPMILYLLPLLIGYTGGRMVHGLRGAVVGAIGTMGVIVGSDKPQFLAAMLIGPLTAYLLKQVDKLTAGRTKAGFEMLVDNFTAGILGGGMALLGVLGIGPVFRTFTNVMGDAVAWVVDHNLLPLASIFIEPAKVLFLNNAINQGVLTPLGATQSAEHGKSILFMLESNPGPGLGLLVAFLLFGPTSLRPTTPGAIIIHFLGGIHEIYFPYVLMKPRLLLAMIAGGASGVTVFMITGSGLVASPSPGSIFAYLIQTPKGGHLGVLAGVLISTLVTFAVASVLLGFGRFARKEEEEEKAAADSPSDVALGVVR